MCSSFTPSNARSTFRYAIANGEEDTHVIGFPGCYDNAYAIRLMLALARHPNVGAVLSVGLGCEYTQPEKIADAVRASGRPAEWFFIQQSGGTKSSVAKGKEIVARLREQIRKETPRVPMTLADLTVGCECGGSDGTSGLAGNPAVGAFFDLLVDAGGRAIFEETAEMIGLARTLCNRAPRMPKRSSNSPPLTTKPNAIAMQFANGRCRREILLAASRRLRRRALGHLPKAARARFKGVIRVAEQPRGPGLWILDSVPDEHFMQFGYTNPNDTEGIMDLISAGSQIVLFVTGRGSVIGSPVAPLIKITGNSATFRAMQEDMDFDAGRVLAGELTLPQAGRELAEMIVRVASGEPSKPERLGHREYFIMYKHQNTPSLSDGCRA